MLRIYLILLFSVFLLFSCSKKEKKAIVSQPTDEEMMIVTYSEAVEALKKGDAFVCGNQFGKVSGIVYGGTSRKIKNYLQLTNKVFIVYNSKNENKIGYFKTELVEAIAPKYFDDKNKILCLNSISSMLKVLLPENLCLTRVFFQLY